MTIFPAHCRRTPRDRRCSNNRNALPAKDGRRRPGPAGMSIRGADCVSRRPNDGRKHRPGGGSWWIAYLIDEGWGSQVRDVADAAIKPRLKRAMVPRRGLEPPRLAAHGPEPCASTNSATWAGVRPRLCGPPCRVNRISARHGGVFVAAGRRRTPHWARREQNPSGTAQRKAAARGSLREGAWRAWGRYSRPAGRATT